MVHPSPADGLPLLDTLLDADKQFLCVEWEILSEHLRTDACVEQ